MMTATLVSPSPVTSHRGRATEPELDRLDRRDNNMEQLLTTREIADKLKLNVETVRRKLRNHDIPAKKVGRLWRVSDAELQRYIDR